MAKVGPKALRVLEYLVKEGRPVTLDEIRAATKLPGQVAAGAITHLCNKSSNLVYKIPGNPAKYLASSAGARYLDERNGNASPAQQQPIVTPLHQEPYMIRVATPLLSAAELISLNARAYVSQEGEHTSIYVVQEEAGAVARAS